MKRLLLSLAVVLALIGLATSIFAQKINNVSGTTESLVHIGLILPNGNIVPGGTAFFVKDGTYIATAAHVYWEIGKAINDSRGGIIVAVKTSRSGKKFTVPVQLAAIDDAHDLATFRIDPAVIKQQWAEFTIKPLALAEKDAEQGEQVYLVGYFGGDDFPIAIHGIVAGFVKLQTATQVEEMLLDLIINKGESGAPIISQETGQVVAIGLSTIEVGPVGSQSHVGVSRAAKSQFLLALLNSPVPR